MKFLTPTSPEWASMWDALAHVTGDYADCCPETGEVWQYMGTFGVVHQFRHRHRPKTTRPIKGFVGKHQDRVYLDINTESLQVVRVNVQLYFDPDRIPAGLSDSRAIGERTEAGREQNRIDRPRARQIDDGDYGGAFDGFTVTSDADPGL